jgi:hypothetical protein
MTETADIHDTSDIDRLDQHFAERRDAELNARMDAEKAKTDVARSAALAERIRKIGIAALMGGAGLGTALFGASFMLHPRVVYLPGKEIFHETIKEIPGPERIVTKEVPGPERIVTKEVLGPERIVYVTQAEKEFISRPDYETAEFHGRIVPDNHTIKFDTGKSFYPSKNGTTEDDSSVDYDTASYIGDYAYCNHKHNDSRFYDCYVIHNDIVKDLSTSTRPHMG